jgi:hypothetical protein
MVIGTGINFRGDLAKLTDAELAERLQKALDDFNEANNRRGISGWSWPIWRWRGPIRHPRVYRAFSSLFGGSNGNLFFDLVWALGLSGKLGDRLLRKDRAIAMHLSLCEIEDLIDEAKRRGGHKVDDLSA